MKVLIDEKNIKQVISDFDAIEAAIENAGVDVPKGTDTKDYPSKIGEITDKAYNSGYSEGYEDGFEEASLESEEITITDKGDIAVLPDTAEVGDVYSVPTESVPKSDSEYLEFVVSGVNSITYNEDFGAYEYDIDDNTALYDFILYAKEIMYGEVDATSEKSYIGQNGVWYLMGWVTSMTHHSDSGKEVILANLGTDINALLVNGNTIRCYSEDMSYLPDSLKQYLQQEYYFKGQHFMWSGSEWVAVGDTRDINPEWTDWSYFFKGRLDLLPKVKYNDTSKGTNFEGLFKNGFSGLKEVPLLDTSKGTNFSSMFYDCSAIKTIPPFDMSKGTNFSAMFWYCNLLTTVPPLNTSKGTSFSTMFYYCRALTTVESIDFTSSTRIESNVFTGCTNLTNLNVAGTINATGLTVQDAPLSHDSLMSIINALADKTGASGTFKVTLGSTNYAKLTAEEILIAENKGWTVA